MNVYKLKFGWKWSMDALWAAMEGGRLLLQTK